jgi:hypothetical protein
MSQVKENQASASQLKKEKMTEGRKVGGRWNQLQGVAVQAREI